MKSVILTTLEVHRQLLKHRLFALESVIVKKSSLTDEVLIDEKETVPISFATIMDDLINKASWS